MTGIRTRERGVALVVVLVLVATSTVLAVAGMQSTLTNERIVGNYRAVADARREAELGVAEFFDAFRDFAAQHPSDLSRLHELTDVQSRLDKAEAPTLDERQAANRKLEEALHDLQEKSRNSESGDGDWMAGQSDSLGEYRITPVAAFQEPELLDDAGGFWIQSDGKYGPEGRRASYRMMALIRLPRAEEENNAFDGLVSCEGVSVRGSGIIDSYDARQGDYGGDNAKRRNVTIGASSSESWVMTTGASPIYGEVKTAGGFRAQGSGSLHGNLWANGPIQIQGGGAVVYGSVSSQSDVNISSSGTVQGDVTTNGTLYLGNWSSWIEGDAVAAVVESVREAQDQVGGSLTVQENGAGVSGVSASGECPTHNVGERYASYMPAGEAAVYGALSLGGGNRTVVLDAFGLHDPKNGTRDVVTELDDGRQLARFSSLNLGGSANLRVGSPGNPVDMVLWVPGEIHIGGGGSFSVAEGSRLTIVTASPFNLGSGIQMADDSPSRINDDGDTEATLTLISTYDDQGDSQPGVKVRGASSFYGQIIAPYSRLDIGGSGGFYGAANARWIDVSGAGGFHYDESFADVTLEAGPGVEQEPGTLPSPRLEAMW